MWSSSKNERTKEKRTNSSQTKKELEIYNSEEYQAFKENTAKRIYIIVQRQIEIIKKENLGEKEEEKKIEKMIDAVCRYVEKTSGAGFINNLAFVLGVYRRIKNIPYDQKLSRISMLKMWVEEYAEKVEKESAIYDSCIDDVEVIPE